jgi:dTDP-L-rhamnose 4-epimerase
MSVYGEGLYRTPGGRVAEAVERDRRRLERGLWEPCGAAGEPLEPLPTPETKPASLASIYALGKFHQERMCLLFGSSFAVPTTALRLFNVYGPGQALSNPYTGLLAIFGTRLLLGRAPLIFEDGLQRRDFVSVHDVAQAFALALERGPGEVVNIASGRSVTVLELATRLAAVLGRADVEPDVTGRHRVGDVRHCFADVSRAREVLGHDPTVGLDEGMLELAEWLGGQAADDRVEAHHADLAARGLTL